MQQHDEHSGEPGETPAPLDHSVVLRSLWPSLVVDDSHALRLCCSSIRDAVEAQAGRVEGQAESPVLSSATVARLSGVHTLTLRSMRCLRGVLVLAPPQPGAFPHMKSLRLHLGAAAIGSADYEAITSAAPRLTHFSLELPASATALPQEMVQLLSACSKLEDLALSVHTMTCGSRMRQSLQTSTH
ncbi:hypothetical protein FOA52_001008 [Chlamydomonas sp. UWO 241]|nr:hypothetical protein FOA52_001008 [Chlamydomonas sp. UWO 241]